MILVFLEWTIFLKSFLCSTLSLHKKMCFTSYYFYWYTQKHMCMHAVDSTKNQCIKHECVHAHTHTHMHRKICHTFWSFPEIGSRHIVLGDVVPAYNELKLHQYSSTFLLSMVILFTKYYHISIQSMLSSTLQCRK